MNPGYFYFFSHEERDDLVPRITRIKMGFVKKEELENKLNLFNNKIVFFIIEIDDINRFSITLKCAISCYFPVTTDDELKRLINFLKSYFIKNNMINLIFDERFKKFQKSLMILEIL